MSRLSSFLRSRCTLQGNATSWRTSVASGGGIFLFLYLLQPFGISQYRGSIFLMCLGFGVLTACVLWLGSVLFFKTLSYRKIAVTNGHQILYSIGIELAMAVSMTVYAAFFFHIPLTGRLFWVFFYWTFLVWVIVTGIFTLINYNRMLTCSFSTRMSSRRLSPNAWAIRRFLRLGSVRMRRVPCCCRAVIRVSAPRCGSSVSVRRSC